MAQFARPEATITTDSYLDQAGASADLVAPVDETSQDNGDYVRSPATPTSDVLVYRLSDITDPLSSTGYTFRYSYGKNAASGHQIDLVAQLRQDYVNEGSPGTLIKQNTHTNVGAFPLLNATALSASEADAITDHGNLFARFVYNKP